jgi:hypothetical protein
MHMHAFEASLVVLKLGRKARSSRLDDGELVELDEAIKCLELALDRHSSAEEVEKLRLRSLQALAAFVSITTNIRDWLM